MSAVGRPFGREERGSALVEAIVAVVLLAVASAATTGVVRTTAASHAASQLRRSAAAVASDEVERLRSHDPDALLQRVDVAPGRQLLEVRTVERDGRRWRVDLRLARTGSAASGALCAGQPATDVRPLRGTVRVSEDGSPPEGPGLVSVPIALGPSWPTPVDGALVVRVTDAGPLATPLAGVAVEVEGPLEDERSDLRVTVTDDAGCAWTGGLDTGRYRVRLLAAGRLDPRHRAAGPLPDGSAPDAGSDVTYVVGVSRGSRPALAVALARASGLRIDVLLPDGAAAPESSAVGEALSARGPGLGWWIEDDPSRDVTALEVTRWVAPGLLSIAVGRCRPADPSSVEEDVARAAVLVIEAEEVLHLMPLVPVRVVLPARETGDDDGEGPDDDASSATSPTAAPAGDPSMPSAADPRILVAVLGVDCPLGPVEWRWPVRDGEVLIGLPPGTVRLGFADGPDEEVRDGGTIRIPAVATGPLVVELGR